MLTAFGQDIFFIDGPAVSFHGFPYPTRMAIVRLSSGAAWIWSPVALTEELAAAVQALGPVEHIVSPNTFGMGVVSGIVMPFQFGTNRSRFGTSSP